MKRHHEGKTATVGKPDVFRGDRVKAAAVTALHIKVNTEPTAAAIKELREAIDDLAAACERAKASAYLRVDLKVAVSTTARADA